MKTISYSDISLHLISIGFQLDDMMCMGEDKKLHMRSSDIIHSLLRTNMEYRDQEMKPSPKVEVDIEYLKDECTNHSIVRMTSEKDREMYGSEIVCHTGRHQTLSIDKFGVIVRLHTDLLDLVGSIRQSKIIVGRSSL